MSTPPTAPTQGTAQPDEGQLSKEEIAALDEALAAGTPTPWEAGRTDDRWEIRGRCPNGLLLLDEDPETTTLTVGWIEPSRPGFSHPLDAADAKKIAAALNALPRLLAEVKRRRAETAGQLRLMRDVIGGEDE